MNRPLEEREKVRKLLKGINLFYRSRIRASEVRTIKALRRECKEIEEDKPQLLKLVKDTQKKEDRGKAVKVSSLQGKTEEVNVDVDSDSNLGAIDVATVSSLNISPKMVQCWRCGKAGHFAHQCPEKISCIGCGLADVIIERCQRCAQAQAKGTWGNLPTSWMGGNPGQVVLLPPMNVPPPRIVSATARAQNPQNSQNPKSSRTFSSPQVTQILGRQDGKHSK